jgi:hypothetical protein
LAGALLALVKSGDRAVEDFRDALTQANKDADLYAKKDQANHELRAENQRLKDALFFWLPNIPAVENECTERMANDAALLIGHEGRIDDSAEQRGWITLTTPNALGQGSAACGASPAPTGCASGGDE